jgi:DNA repair protein RecN (Recombination protein N)
MLERLTIRDLALVERAEVVFGPGLNVVTGETGAGKTLLVESASLLVGGRADAEVVREGAAAAIVEGEFLLQGPVAARVRALLAEWGMESDDDTLVVRREVQAGGRSRAAVNQSPVTLAALKRLGEILADLHGQHDHQSLLRPGAGLDTLDRLARLEPERAAWDQASAAHRSATSALALLEQSLATYEERRDHLVTAARELDDARLVEGEDEDLAREAARLRHADHLRELAATALDRLSDGEAPAVDALGAAAHAVEQAAALDTSLEALLPTLVEARIAAADASRSLADYLSGLDTDPRALEDLESRRDLIARLVRRYRRDVPTLLRWREEIARELADGEDAEGSRSRARAALDAATEACLAAGRALSARRREAARTWGTRITRELAPLGLAKARLEFHVETRASEAAHSGPAGLDEVEMRFTANPGESPRPLGRIASGGELSRVMLALKSALEAQDSVDLLLFDEVDSGIGGAVAQAVGERLRSLAERRQVVCVTHLPMIAALATHHLRVSKHTVAGRTVARVEALQGEMRVDELARMLAGDRASETTRRQALELLGAAPARTRAR